MEPSTARHLWLVGEPLHAVTYFAPESFAAWEAAGLRGFWRGYFATRAAPLGATGPGPVTATFFNFAPTMVERALPSVWDLASPAEALAARSTGSTDALRQILGEAAASSDIGVAAAITRRAVDACSTAGRALFAANAALPWPDGDLAALWHGLTCLREHRGDGHNAALVAADLDGCQAHVLASTVAAGGTPREMRQGARGWTDDDWADAERRLRERGLLDDAGGPTDAGRAVHADVEARTDAAALAPWRTVGERDTAQLETILRPLAQQVAASGVVPFPNPMGLSPLAGA